MSGFKKMALYEVYLEDKRSIATSSTISHLGITLRLTVFGLQCGIMRD